jgi:glucose/arabinose dehydrogenase
MGLLGLAFHPEYADNGRFYVYYSAIVDGEHNGRRSEFTISPDDEELADPTSERVLIEVEQPEDNHNGGDVEFGPDGMLYLGLGDGGGANDQHGAIGNGQNLETLLGKLLRIDVDGTGSGPNGAYAIPSGNMGGEALPEIWSYGWRNPWRFSFDGCTGAMYIADVGQNEIEEVNYEPPGVSGRNYGWRLMEGDACFNPSSGCNAATQNLTLPVAVYDHDAGLSITGGYVYRGRAIPDLRGVYLYADYVTNRFFALRMDGETVAREQEDITDNINPMGDVRDITSFGQSNDGEVYVLSLAGSVYRVAPE